VVSRHINLKVRLCWLPQSRTMTMTSALGKVAYRSPAIRRRNAKRGLAVNPLLHENSLFSSAHGFIRGDTWHQATTPVLHCFLRRWCVGGSQSIVKDAHLSPSVGKALTCFCFDRDLTCRRFTEGLIIHIHKSIGAMKIDRIVTIGLVWDTKCSDVTKSSFFVVKIKLRQRYPR